MLAKNWKRILLIIVIILCVVNGIKKLTKKVSFDEAIEAIKTSIQTKK